MTQATQPDTVNSGDMMAQINALVAQAAEAPGERTQAIAAQKVEAALAPALKAFAAELADAHNVSVDIHIGGTGR